MKTLTEYKDRLIIVNNRISKLEGVTDYTDLVAKSFYLGMVGGSGRNTSRLNKRRERSMDASIKRAVLLVPLYKERSNLERNIEDIESGKAEKKALTVIDRRQAMAEYWRRLKVGDELNVGNSNGNPIIKKKNRLSAETTSGTKWTASEVIGREASRLI